MLLFQKLSVAWHFSVIYFYKITSNLKKITVGKKECTFVRRILNYLELEKVVRESQIILKTNVESTTVGRTRKGGIISILSPKKMLG